MLCWCMNCRQDSSCDDAEYMMPCKNCGGSDYFIAGSDDEMEIRQADRDADRLMAFGLWKEAADRFAACECFERSELMLRLSTVEWRKECAEFVESSLAYPVSVSDLREIIEQAFDQCVADWILQEYRGIVIEPDIDTYTVRRSDR